MFTYITFELRGFVPLLMLFPWGFSQSIFNYESKVLDLSSHSGAITDEIGPTYLGFGELVHIFAIDSTTLIHSFCFYEDYVT